MEGEKTSWMFSVSLERKDFFLRIKYRTIFILLNNVYLIEKIFN